MKTPKFTKQFSKSHETPKFTKQCSKSSQTELMKTATANFNSNCKFAAETTKKAHQNQTNLNLQRLKSSILDSPTIAHNRTAKLCFKHIKFNNIIHGKSKRILPKLEQNQNHLHIALNNFKP